jgi:Na+-transporting methylmalonyl-CoA/oxaloacetate decarboxylase gamma subunit
MDNVFEILIYLIIIISFLSSIFKKKKQQQQKPPIRQPQPEETYQADVSVPQTQPKEEYDVLRELEDFFKVGNEPTKQEIPAPVPQEQPKKMTQIEEHTLDESWHTPTVSEHIADDREHKKEEVRKIIAKVDSDIEKKAAIFEESLERKEFGYSSIALSVRSKIRNPSTLKEYIIFSEILGKPKALRR